MRTYETIFIVHPEVVGDDQTAIIDKYKTILSDQGAEVLKVENWGVRNLAYQVKKQSKGCYVLIIFDAEPSVIAAEPEAETADEAEEEEVAAAAKEKAAEVEAPAAAEASDEETKEEA